MGDKYEKLLPEPQKIYVVDFFCGCGGMSWGFKKTRQSHLAFEVLAGIDINAHALASYAKNIGARALSLDIFEIAQNPEILLAKIPELAKNMEWPLLFVGCAPCQGFSAHRKKDPRDDDRNNLMFAFANICNYFNPEYVVMENVPEILSGRFESYYHRAKDALSQGGYKINESILDLSLFGVPQRRRRALVLASKKAVIPMPEPVFSIVNAPTVRDAISHLCEIKAGETDKTDPMHRAPNHTSRIIEKIKNIPPNGGDRRALPESDQLDCHNKVDGSNTPGFTDVYGRLRWDSPSVTITAKSSTPSCGRFLHPEQHRNISIREAAILQGFPQFYEFKGPFAQCYRQVGEAVPPLFARYLAKSILDNIRPKIPLLWPAMKKHESFKESSHCDRDHLVVDTFCGAGGISLGFDWAGFKTAYAFDVDEDAVATFKQNIAENVEVQDVRSDAVRIGILEAVRKKPYVLVGGPPCQGFSQQRRGEDEDPRNNLVLAYADLVKDLSEAPPAAVVLENVTYLDSPRGRNILAEFTNAIEGEGYSLQRFDMNSAEFGVPQLRRRIVLVATRRQLGRKRITEISPLTKNVWPTVGDTMRDLPDTHQSHGISNHEPSLEGALNRRRISFVDMGGGRLSIPQELQLSCHRNYNGHLDVYGRLDWFGPARTITAGFDSFTRGEFAHPFLNRSITHREGARIQGFPDYIEFVGNRAAVRRQIGNAVPPPLAFAVAMSIKSWIEDAIPRPALIESMPV
jgi:DNA (cytosine-5)-methyltransferase 1